MSKNLYIDASHPNETRVVLKSEDNIEDYEYESINNSLIKNNIYLGKVSRIEPSLQAAFIDFGKERHGFLSFNDIQSDYYQIPKSDLKVIKEEEEKVREELSKEKEAKEDENLAEGNLEIDDPIEKKDTENKDNFIEEKEKKNLNKFIKGTFCGLANLDIATGVQGKILTYMSYGVPVICSKKVASNFSQNVMSYKNYQQFVEKILVLNRDKKLSNLMSKKSLSFVNNFKWNKIARSYLKLVKS